VSRRKESPTAPGFSRTGARFYVWDEDERSLRAWVDELSGVELALGARRPRRKLVARLPLREKRVR
jgi:hypothetical protein